MPNNRQPIHGASGTSTSRSLLDRLRGDQPDAWERLVTLYSPLVHHWCRRYHLPEQEMPDVFQQVFQSVASHIGDFRKDGPADTFRGWLRVITRNKIRDHFRRKSRQLDAVGGTDAQIRFAQVPDPFADDNGRADEISDAADREIYGAVLRTAMELIREQFQAQTWEAFRRVVVEGKPPVEVAEELDMRPGTVRVAKCRVLARLREELGESGGGPSIDRKSTDS